MPKLVRFAESFDLDGHMALLRQVLEESLLDPEVMSLAARITSGAYDGHAPDPNLGGASAPIITAWGSPFWAPRSEIPHMKDALAELKLFWEFGVLNMRYVYDMNHFDGFKTIRRGLLDRAGDCDDAVILFNGLARAVGFNHCLARVMSDDGQHWQHVYPVIGVGKDTVEEWFSLDMAVSGAHFGWEAPAVARRDFPMA